jgi:hypothetical protein
MGAERVGRIDLFSSSFRSLFGSPPPPPFTGFKTWIEKIASFIQAGSQFREEGGRRVKSRMLPEWWKELGGGEARCTIQAAEGRAQGTVD